MQLAYNFFWPFVFGWYKYSCFLTKICMVVHAVNNEFYTSDDDDDITGAIVPYMMVL